jgi:hypothetical protein
MAPGVHGIASASDGAAGSGFPVHIIHEGRAGRADGMGASVNDDLGYVHREPFLTVMNSPRCDDVPHDLGPGRNNDAPLGKEGSREESGDAGAASVDGRDRRRRLNNNMRAGGNDRRRGRLNRAHGNGRGDDYDLN